MTKEMPELGRCHVINLPNFSPVDSAIPLTVLIEISNEGEALQCFVNHCDAEAVDFSAASADPAEYSKEIFRP